MSDQADQTRSVRAKRWTEAKGCEVQQESALSAVKFAAQRGVTATRLSYWEERLRQVRTFNCKLQLGPMEVARVLRRRERDRASPVNGER